MYSSIAVLSLLCSFSGQGLLAQAGLNSERDEGCIIAGEKDAVAKAASAIGVCEDLRALSLAHSNKSAGNPAIQAIPMEEQLRDLQNERQVFEHRQNMTDAVTRLLANSEDLLVTLNDAMDQFRDQDKQLEERRYRRTKWANAIVGATIGMIGSGLQVSSSTTTQHIGDWISVAGGAFSIAFAVCTAEIDGPKDKKKAKGGAEVAESRTKPELIPDDVWALLDEPGRKSSLKVVAALQTKYKNPKGCHIWKTDDEKQLEEAEKSLESFERSVVSTNTRALELLNRADVLAR